jgi:predicted ester cyclase
VAIEANKALVRRRYDELVMKGNFALLAELVHADDVDHAQPPGWPTDREGLRRQVASCRGAFPDLQVTTEGFLAEGDLVAHRQTLRSTHRGEFFGIPPTGRRVAMAGLHLFRVKDGQLVEHRANNDDLRLLRQLGAIPAAP